MLRQIDNNQVNQLSGASNYKQFGFLLN